MASPLGDSLPNLPFRPPLAESAASVPSLPVTPGGFPALLDAARQQTELVFWIVRTVQEHEGRLQSLSRQLADQLSVTKLLSEDRKTFRATKSRNWQAGLGNRGLSRESFHSGDGTNLSQGASSPTYQDAIDTVEDKTHIEENLDTDLHQEGTRTETEDDGLMPVDGVATVTSLDPEAEGSQERQLSEVDLAGDQREPTRDSTDARSTSMAPPARRFSFIEGGRRPSTRSLPLQVDPSFASSLLTEERFAERLEERLQQVLAEDVEHRLEDLAQYIQEEMYHFVLGPDMMERIRQESSQVLNIELAIALAAQDKKMEELVQSRLHGSLSQVSLSPPEIPPEALSSLRQASEEMNELTDELSKRVKMIEENVSELKGIRLQVPDMRNDIGTLQTNLAACVHSIEELEVQTQELAARKPSRNASPVRQVLSPSGSAADDHLVAEELQEQPEASQSGVPGPSPVPSPSQMVREASPEIPKPKRRLSDMLGLYMPPAQKPPAVDDSQVQELKVCTENMKTRLDQMEQLVGTEASSRRNSLQNKINDVDTLASILEDRMRELDNEFRLSNQKVQSQLDVLLAAHETQQAEDLKHNKTWNLANQVDVILSVINSEMRTLRSDFDQKLSSAIIGGGPRKDSDPSDGPRDVQDLEDKVKRLQDSQQQSMLKIAGLRSAHKHAEAQANFALEKLKRMQVEVGNIVDQVVTQQTRLDYLLVHGAAMQQKDSSFKAIVSVGDAEKKPKLKGGATMPTRAFEKTTTQGDVAGPDVVKLDTTSDEVNASRIAKMGKRLLELDGEVNRTVVDLRGEIQAVNKTLLAFLELLPRRLRRMLQRQLFPEPSEEEPADVKVEFKSDEGKRHVTFGDRETRTFTVEEDDSRLPWQLAGEPDIKWSWCYKPRDEMGRDLAMCLEQFETERDDFEAKIVQWLQHGGVPPPVNAQAARKSVMPDVMIANFAEDSQVVSGPQMMVVEDRLERLGSEFFNLKRAQENNQVRKADKEEVQQLLARLTFFEKLNIPDLKIRIESLEGDTKFAAQNVSDIAEKLYKVESVAVPRSELVKVQNGFEDLRSDHQAMKVELKEMSATTYNSNRKFVHEMAEAKAWTQQAIVALQKNKADNPDLAQLSEKVSKLEYSIKDNRRILGDAGGQEINAVVRRIILNLEDKIMVLEKKIDALADGRPKDGFRSKEDLCEHQHSASYQSTEMQEAAVQSISEELSVMTEAVSKLKQDISVSKVHIDEMTEQGQQNLELASRLHVLVHSTSLEGMDDEGTALSLTRVQVMIAAAARQLVAGSKWITKETFDSRMDQIRGEYFKEIRVLQGRLEELMLKVQHAAPLQVNMPAVPAKLPKMIFQKVPGQATPAQSEADRLGTAPAGGARVPNLAAQPMSARGMRPATEGRPRGRQGHQ